MMMRVGSCLLLIGTLGTLLAQPTNARGQYQPSYYPPPAPPPYYNPYYGYNYGRGSALTGAANVINAQGELQIQNQQARIASEQANQAYIQTRKQAFDEYKYEKDNTPSFTDQQDDLRKLQLRAALNDPPVNEITSARALNTLLPYLQRLIISGTVGPPIPVDQDALKHVNVTVGSTGNPGVLRYGGEMSWPIALRGDVQKELQNNIVQAVNLARSDNLNVEILGKINSDVAKLDKSLSDNFRAEKIDAQMYVNGKEFLRQLRDGLRVLQSPNATQFLTGQISAQGKTVQELVANLAKQGAKFAPAVPGNEAAYISVYNSLLAYAMSASGDNGFQLRLGSTYVAKQKS